MVRLIYPPRCLGCGALVESDFGLCGGCWRETPFIDGAVCGLCGVPLQGARDEPQLECDACISSLRPWTQGRATLLYRDCARRLVLALKHGDRPEIARAAGVWMARSAHPILSPGMIVTPVPLHRTRLLRRRYNQSALLSQALAANTGLDHCPDLLVRRKRTAKLDGKGAVERQAELDGAITAHPRRLTRLRGKRVLVVDDVMTSGATLAACSAACLVAGADEVRILVLARAARDD